MLALCLMLLATYYAQNYAGIIGWSLAIGMRTLLDEKFRIEVVLHYKPTFLATESFL